MKLLLLPVISFKLFINLNAVFSNSVIIEEGLYEYYMYITVEERLPLGVVLLQLCSVFLYKEISKFSTKQHKKRTNT